MIIFYYLLPAQYFYLFLVGVHPIQNYHLNTYITGCHYSLDWTTGLKFFPFWTRLCGFSNI